MMNNARIAVAVLALSATGLVGILTREDIRTDAYADPVHGWKVATIGAGSIEGVRKGDRITPLAAVQRAAREVQVYEGALKRCVKVPLHQAEYDAYVQLAHNIGAHAFCVNDKGEPAIIVRHLNSGDYAGACNGILAYDRAGPVNRPLDRCSHPDNRTCRGLWKDRQRLHKQCMEAQ